MGEVMDDAFGNWLVGFIEGEGCFRIHKEKQGGYYACHFSLKLRDDDRAILDEIVECTKVGHVKPDRSRSGNSKPCAVWVVASKRDCVALVKLLDNYQMRARKGREYVIWREAVDCWINMKKGSRWHGPRDWTPMINYKKAIENARTYHGG